MQFEWHAQKNQTNIAKHGVSFELAKQVFSDKKCVILLDEPHSTPAELRFYCLGKVLGEIMTVRFTYRGEKIRIIGAGFWRKGDKIYEKYHQK
jgi:uncharacterized DUF497 family protein